MSIDLAHKYASLRSDDEEEPDLFPGWKPSGVLSEHDSAVGDMPSASDGNAGVSESESERYFSSDGSTTGVRRKAPKDISENGEWENTESNKKTPIRFSMHKKKGSRDRISLE